MIYKELISYLDFFISYIPGALGQRLRRLWFSFRFNTNAKVSIEPGCEFISPNSITIKEIGVSIGRNCYFNADGGFIQIGTKTSFNRNVHINASIGGKISIGDFVLIGPNVVMRSANHKFDDPSTYIKYQGHQVNDIIIENNVWIASNVIIVGGVRIGEGSVIGAGAVVTKDIPSRSIAIGVPARVIKSR